MRNRILIISFVMISCVNEAQHCDPSFEKGVSLGTNKNHNLEEASGLAASFRNRGYLWTHNDSGHPAQIFLLDQECKTVKTFDVPGATNRDWEDIASGPGPSDSIRYLYIGDIGDNQRKYPVKRIYRIPEPSLHQTLLDSSIAMMPVRLPGGARDTEALFCDPLTNQLYLISKHEKQVHLYKMPNVFTGDTITASEVGRLPFLQVVAADVSPNGSEILVKTYDHIYYWKRKAGESIEQTLTKEATELCYDREPQGEAIAWGADGKGYYTLGENAKGERSRLYFYKRN